MAYTWHSTKIGRAAVLGLLVAFAGIAVGFTPPGRWVEENLGQHWLFNLRGPLPAPDGVVVVTIDRESSDRLGLPNVPRKWPRDLHAKLVGNLARAGAAVVAFDIIFEEPRGPEQDGPFARALGEAGNVLLFQYLKKESLQVNGAAGNALGEVLIEKLVPPIPEFAGAALGLAPFALPKVPARVSQAWLFDPQATDAPTLPVVALQISALGVYERLVALLRETAGKAAQRLPADAQAFLAARPVNETVRAISRMFAAEPALAARIARRLEADEPDMAAQDLSLLHALIAVYSGPHSRYLNFYGPPRTVTTVPYVRVLEMYDADANDARAKLPDFTGKAVFVGFSEQLQPEQKDGFYTVYTQETGLDVSGVEIMATTYANILGRSALRVPGPGAELAVLLLWGLLLGALLRLITGRLLVPLAAAVSVGYFLLAYALFVQQLIWLPLLVPLLWQAPLAVVVALVWRYREAHRERENIRQAFGYHLPPEVVDQLAGGMHDMAASSQQMYGICLATDAGQYTTLSEQLAPAELRDLMNAYYEVIFAPVRSAGGVVSDVVGDAMLAVWAARTPQRELRRRACGAALKVVDAVTTFNRERPQYPLPTRLGLHCGEVVLGHVGAIDHYEYRAVGDIVNTATRIE
ncbi:MAG: adenylate/guanylate cyclase domain-containing protein, partial [Pseudomonadota bacterium]